MLRQKLTILSRTLLATLLIATSFSSKSFAQEIELEITEIKQGEPAPGHGLWIPYAEAVYLLARTEELILVEVAYREALVKAQELTDKTIEASRKNLEEMTKLNTQVIDLNERLQKSFNEKDMIMAASAGAGVMAVALLVLLIFSPQ